MKIMLLFCCFIVPHAMRIFENILRIIFRPARKCFSRTVGDTKVNTKGTCQSNVGLLNPHRSEEFRLCN